ncbi:MAG: hypothetical protein WA876_03115 [Candidatus Acidiferrales bacterium]
MTDILEYRHSIAGVLALATGLTLFYLYPFPESNIFLRVIFRRAPEAYLSFKYLTLAMLYTQPLGWPIPWFFRASTSSR